MDPNDPILIQQQQHAENLRRLQHAENQRRLDHQQLLEDEEREELQRGARAVTAGTDGEEPKRRRWLFGAKRAAADKDGQPHEGSADVDSDDPREAPLEPSHTSSSGMSTVVWVGALLLAGLLVWVFGTRFMKGAEQPKPAVAQTRTDAGLPLAAPGIPCPCRVAQACRMSQAPPWRSLLPSLCLQPTRPAISRKPSLHRTPQPPRRWALNQQASGRQTMPQPMLPRQTAPSPVLKQRNFKNGFPCWKYASPISSSNWSALASTTRAAAARPTPRSLHQLRLPRSGERPSRDDQVFARRAAHQHHRPRCHQWLPCP